jgi:hypothetical protein
LLPINILPFIVAWPQAPSGSFASVSRYVRWC